MKTVLLPMKGVQHNLTAYLRFQDESLFVLDVSKHLLDKVESWDIREQDRVRILVRPLQIHNPRALHGRF